jgi:hypothetical protein
MLQPPFNFRGRIVRAIVPTIGKFFRIFFGKMLVFEQIPGVARDYTFGPLFYRRETVDSSSVALLQSEDAGLQQLFQRATIRTYTLTFKPMITRMPRSLLVTLDRRRSDARMNSGLRSGGHMLAFPKGVTSVAIGIHSFLSKVDFVAWSGWVSSKHKPNSARDAYVHFARRVNRTEQLAQERSPYETGHSLFLLSCHLI